MNGFKGKVAVITGAASGIGLGLARRCAKEGINLVLADIDEKSLAAVESEFKSLGIEAHAVITDVSKRSDVEQLAQATIDRFGSVDLLFNNAGIGAGNSAWGSTWNEWEWSIRVNLWSVIYGVKIFTPIMLAQNSEAHIINTASSAGLIVHHPSAPYHLTKHAVIALSENLYISMVKRNAKVKVHALCPGWVKTNILNSERTRPIDLRDPPADISPEQVKHDNALQDLSDGGITPEEVADHVFKGIRENRFYILTHSTDMVTIEERMANIVGGHNPHNF